MTIDELQQGLDALGPGLRVEADGLVRIYSYIDVGSDTLVLYPTGADDDELVRSISVDLSEVEPLPTGGFTFPRASAFGLRIFGLGKITDSIRASVVARP